MAQMMMSVTQPGCSRAVNFSPNNQGISMKKLSLQYVSVIFSVFGFINLLLYCSYNGVPFPINNFFTLDIVVSAIFFLFSAILFSPFVAAYFITRLSDVIKNNFAKYTMSFISVAMLSFLYYIYYKYIIRELSEIVKLGEIPPYEYYENLISLGYVHTFFISTLILSISILTLSLTPLFRSQRILSLFSAMKMLTPAIFVAFFLLYIISPLPAEICGFSLNFTKYGNFIGVISNKKFVDYVLLRSNFRDEKNVKYILVKFVIRENKGYFCKIRALVKDKKKPIPIGIQFIKVKNMEEYDIYPK